VVDLLRLLAEPAFVRLVRELVQAAVLAAEKGAAQGGALEKNGGQGVIKRDMLKKAAVAQSVSSFDRFEKNLHMLTEPTTLNMAECHLHSITPQADTIKNCTVLCSQTKPSLQQRILPCGRGL
jgi:hypothetical protein